MMRSLVTISIILLCLDFVPAQDLSTPVEDWPQFEIEAVSLINAVRAEPAEYSKIILGYADYVEGNVLSLPDSVPLRMIEGRPVILDTSRVLLQTGPLEPLCRAKSLDLVAKSQLNDLLVDDTIGHTGLDGSTFQQRLRKFANYSGLAGENIVRNADSPLQAVTTMLLDDGVKSRSHRKALLSKEYSRIGAACGINAKKKPICVFVFGKETQSSELQPAGLAPDTRHR